MSSLMFLIELAMRAALLGVIGIFAAWAFRKRGPETQHLIYRATVAAMLILPVLVAVLPRRTVFPSQSLAILQMEQSITATISPRNAISIIRPSPASPVSLPAKSNRIWWPSLLVGLYGIVALLLLIQTATRVRLAGKWGSSGTRIPRQALDIGFVPAEVRESAEVDVPFTIGWRSPLIVLPRSWHEWDTFTLRSVLAHEIAHIRRADWATSVAASVYRSIFWYHPIAWWLERRLGSLAEEACDASAIRSTGDETRYARVVLEFARSASAQRALFGTSMARTSQVGQRINGILDGRTTMFHPHSRWMPAFVLTLALPAMYAAATLQLTEQSPTVAYTSDWLRNTHQSLLTEGWHTTPADAATLEAQLAAKPEDISVRSRLISYYSQQVIVEQRADHLMWLIEHHPDADIFRLGSELTSLEFPYSKTPTSLINAERGRALWLRQVERYPSNTKVLANAAVALRTMDGLTSLNLIRRARTVEPHDPYFTTWLAAVYARAMRTSIAGGSQNLRALTGNGTSIAVSPFMLPLPESELMKEELETSKDVALVGETGELLLHEISALGRFGHSEPEVAESGIFAKHLLARAHELDPQNPRWQP